MLVILNCWLAKAPEGYNASTRRIPEEGCGVNIEELTVPNKLFSSKYRIALSALSQMWVELLSDV